MLRPETLKVIRESLKILEKSKGNLGDEENKKVDGYMFCIRNCYTEEETVEHMTKKFPSLVPKMERNFFQILVNLIDQKSKQVYLEDAEDCALRRRTGRCDTSEEASSGEASTSHKSEANCSRHPPTE